MSSRQGELIAQAARLHESEAALQRIALSVRSLQSVAARVRAEVAEPYTQILGKSVQLRNLQVRPARRLGGAGRGWRAIRFFAARSRSSCWGKGGSLLRCSDGILRSRGRGLRQAER